MLSRWLGVQIVALGILVAGTPAHAQAPTPAKRQGAQSTRAPGAPTSSPPAAPAPSEKPESPVQLWGAISGLLVAALSALYAGKQASLAKAQIRMVVYTTLTDRVFSVNQLFITHPEFRGYFYEGKHVCRETVGENYDRIVAVAEYILDFCSTLQEHRDILEEKDLFAVLEEKGVIKALKRRGMLRPLQRIDLFQVLRRRCVSWSEWTEYIEDLFESSPMLCQILLEKREWYEESLWNLSPLLREEVREELVDSGTREPIRKFEAERIERILHRLFPPDADAEGGAPSGGVPSPGDIPSLFGGGQAPVVPGLLLGDETSATAPSPLLKSVPPTPRHVRWRTRKWKMARQGAATPPPSGQVSGTTASLDDADASRGLLNLGESDPEASA